ncbi:hypothetical protein F5144DRAFT_650178 [Chaetomium tenue]|uniref:Uncharacterized protein n=1 Tax=Chaetomium tenue TaxID=1854479 RepID=A0ACB7PDS6_9PEZI|nr:hypothetical protein F5144DRAFT_650178 [Chaetomium globosum]
MNGRNNQPAREEEHHLHRQPPTANPASATSATRQAEATRARRLMADIVQEVADMEQAVADIMPGPGHDGLRQTAARIAFALRLLGGVLERLVPRRGGDVAGAVAGPVSVSSSAAAVAGASALGLGARGGFVSGVSGDGGGWAGSGGRGPASSGVVGLGSSGWDAGSADGDSIGDDSTAVASSEDGSANGHWDGR